MNARRRGTVSLFAMALACMATTVVTRAGGQTPLRADSARVKPIFGRSDAAFLGGALATAVLTTQFDGSLARDAQASGDLAGWRTVSSIGAIAPVALPVALFATGLVVRQSEWTNLGREGVEAFALSGVATTLIKGLVGRERPSVANGDIDVYKPGQGFANNAFASFPSGHTTVAFAVATALAAGTVDDTRWVHRTVSILGYTGATAVGLSRMYTNNHWASDVVAGAAIGITSGLAVVRFDHQRGARAMSLSGVERLVDHMTVSPGPRGGMTVAYSLR